MPRLALLALACLSALPATAAEPPAVAAAADAVRGKVVAWRRDIHEHPELSNRETRTAALVAAHLRELGLEPTTGIAHHGVTAVLKGGRPGPRIALRADMDALPVTERVDLPFASKVTTTYRGQETGVMHACGHDAHTAILMGVAEALVGMREDLPGEVLFVFQPAEEGAPEGEQGGAGLMLAEGVFDGFEPDAVFGLHVFSTLAAGKVGVRSGPTMAASDRFTMTVNGRQTHGSRPWGGVDPIVAAAQIVADSQVVVSRQMDISRQPVVVSYGAIQGGIRYNIIPDSVELVGTIRTFDEDMRAEVFEKLAHVAEHVAAANGATVEARIPADEGNPVTFNNGALTARVRPSLEKAVGAENVVEMPLIMGAEDFSMYAQRVPGVFFFVGATPPDRDPETAPSNHSPEFFLDESALEVGTRSMLQVALDYLEAGAAPPDGA
ncbi:amidohydrolase [Coralloluteibacterium stylophorae]|uniref:Amidohydrolase n=1 Tax=Coralloluteibacterium stylophorae TaxID=1776034 RepID=A0A8J8AW39_9GAMM|nr:amidohydrolase [Coralloluteibacterium stylophorae]MBS7458134.1 amidohydrolase [Coralloluteibacterium stylophorae]